MNLFATKLIEAREKKQLAKKEVAELFDWTPMYYGRYENGKLLPTKNNFEKFASFMGLSKDELEAIIDSSRNIADKK